MNRKINAIYLFFLLVCLSIPMDAETKKGLKTPAITYLSLEEYVNLVLKQSDRALVAYNNFQNSTLSYKISYRQSRLPTISADGNLNRSGTEVGDELDTRENATGSATLSQPFYPTGASLSLNYAQNSSRYESDIGSVTHSYTRPSYMLNLTQPLFIFVGNQSWREWEQTQLSYSIAKDQYKREIQSIELEAKALYYSVMQKQAILEVQKNKAISSRKSNKITKALVDAGRMAGSELSRSDVRLKSDLRLVQNAETDLQKAIHDALQFASLKLETNVNFTSKIANTPLEHSEQALVNYALLHRPDYLAAERQLKLAEINVKAAAERDNLTVDAVASLGESESGGSYMDAEKTRYWQGGLNFKWPLFNSGVTSMQIKTAQNYLENDRVAFKGLERTIRTEVSNAVLEVKNYELQLDDIRTSIQLAKKSVEAVRIRYQNGRDRLIDVFDSENDLRNLELEYLNTIVAANLSKDRLAVIVGGPLTEVAK